VKHTIRILLVSLLAAATLVAPAAANASYLGWKWQQRNIYVCREWNYGAGVSLAKSVREWNKGSARIKVRYTQDCNKAHIRVRFRHIEAAGTARIRHNGERVTRCIVTIDPDYRWSRQGKHLVSHELGHCLGLGHNTKTRKRSVMNQGWEIAPAFPMRHDRRKINNLYGGRYDY